MQIQSVNRFSEQGPAGAAAQPADRVRLPGVVWLWTALCGVLAATRWPRHGSDLIALLFVVILVTLGWGTVWRLVTTTDWFGVRAYGRLSSPAGSGRGLPYTQPHSPAGWIGRWICVRTEWWRKVIWPQLGSPAMGVLVAAALIGASLLILPARLGPLHIAFVALVGLALVRQRMGKGCLLGESLAGVSLGWLAGHLAFGEMQWPSPALALCFALCAWGVLRIGSEPAAGRAGLWLLNGGLVLGSAVMIIAKQPLAVVGMGLALFGQVALQLPLSQEGAPHGMVRRAWLWLMAAMVVAALAI